MFSRAAQGLVSIIIESGSELVRVEHEFVTRPEGEVSVRLELTNGAKQVLVNDALHLARREYVSPHTLT